MRHLPPLHALWLFLALTVSGHSLAQSLTDQLTWVPGTVPAGRTNAPDGLDDIWQGKFGAWAIDPHADEDRDGCTNRVEALAGTNPYLAHDCFKVGNMILSGGAVVFSTDLEAGKKYRVLSSGSPGGLDWSPETLQFPVAGVEQYLPAAGQTGALISIQKPANSERFYRLETSDVDSNGDGLSDWAARELGFNPADPDGDSNGDGVADAAEVSQELQAPVADVVTVHVENAFAAEDGGSPATIRLRRNRSLFEATVSYTVGGTASASDYAALSGTVHFARGQREATISVTPSADAQLEGGESVTVTLTGGVSGNAAPLVIEGSGQASVIINNTTAPSGTGLLARYYDNADGNLANGANFGGSGTYIYTRTSTAGTDQGTIVIPFTYNGSPALQPGHLVRLTFTSGGLNVSAYNHLNYTVTAVSPGVNFTCAISGEPLPTNSSGNCYFSVQSFPHPPVVERVDPTVDFEWAYGTPNDYGVTPNNPVDNYSTVFEGYLQPAVAGDYQFQLDADDKARVLLDTNLNGSFDLPGEEILEHGWDGAATPEVVGTFKASAAIPLAVPANAAQRYKIRVEHVETTGEARCRLQWRSGTNSYGNISSSNVFTHARALSSYTVSSQVATINTAVAHGLQANHQVELLFSSGTLFTPPANFSGTCTVASVVDTDTFRINVPGAADQSTGASGFIMDSTSTTAGWLHRVYTNTAFVAPAGRVGVDNGGPTNANNGIWGAGAPDPLIGKDTFSARWTGQIQPQYTEEYTLVVHADDSAMLWINGQLQDIKAATTTNQGGSTYNYNAGTGDAVVSYSNLAVDPNSFIVGEIVRVDPSSGNLTHGNGSTYSYDGNSGVLTVDYSNLIYPLGNLNPGGFAVGETIELDPTSGTLSPLSQLPYVITSEPSNTTFTVYVEPGLYDSDLGGTSLINIADTRNATITAVDPTTFTVNFGTGKYNTGGGNMNVEIVNKALKDWASMGNERYVRLPMIAGARYDIQLDFWESGGYSRCKLYWYSPSQPKQIIPQERLYPSFSGALAPATHTTPNEATALVGGPFSLPLAASNGGSVTISGHPAWLTYSNGVISGTPPPGSAGNYQILVTITNAAGMSTSLLNLRVDNPGGTVVREVWNGIPGASLASIPLSTNPSAAGNLSSLEALTDSGDDYGARIRGYLTAPETGNYYFWIAGSDAAELWISNDDESINSIKRAWVSTGSSTPQTWNAEPNQKSQWLALEQGHRYYFEVLHKAGSGAGDNLAVGWSKPGQSADTPSEIVPGYALAPYAAPAAGSTPGTLYLATMLAVSGVTTTGVGSGTLRVDEDETVASIRFNYSNLSGALTNWHVKSDPFLNHSSQVLYDSVQPAQGDGLQPDGSYKWTLAAAGTLALADVRELIKQGRAYIVLYTADNPGGEIRGNFTSAAGSRTFTPPPAPPSWSDDHTDPAAAARFLTQATFGPRISDITALQAMASYEAWIDDQFTKPLGSHLAEVIRTENASAQGGAWEENLTFNAWWWRSVAGEDQLRQRIAFALSEIHVVSAVGPLDNRANALSYFYDKLAENAFGNFRTILEDTTLTPAMGRYLDMLRNDKPDQTLGRIPNENYAREIKQLFSIGLYRMWPDGTLMLNSKDSPIDTYTQREIIGFAHVFTGWDYGYDGAYRTSFNAPETWVRQMREVPARHHTGPKRLLNNEVLPGLPSVGGQPLDPLAVHQSAHHNYPAYQALPAQELDIAHDQLFNHPNVGPFICRQLIQRLVTSNPSRGYLYRVVQKFNDNGAGVRGDMKAVIKGILLDYEARSPDMLAVPTFGKQREPLLRVAAAARAFRTDTWSGTYNQSGSRTITIDTSSPHKLVAGNNVLLDFGTDGPWTGLYSVLSVPAGDPDTFTVTAYGWVSGTYSIPANSTTCTVTLTNHWLGPNQKAYFDFQSTTPADGIYTTVTSNSTDAPNAIAGSSFTITVPAQAGDRSGTVLIPRFTPGSYTVAASGLAAPNDRRVTMDTNYSHHLVPGNQVQLNFVDGFPKPNDMVVTVDSVVDSNTWTFLASSSNTGLAAFQGYDNVYQFPLLPQPLTRSGPVGNRPSTYAVNNTDLDLGQSPLNSLTVFNFFLPDYKFPGSLASSGITTPEFQLTAETNVVRLSNYLYNGIFTPNNSSLLSSSSFNNGTNALVLDLSPWMAAAASNLGLGAPANASVPWTQNQNLATLIDQLSTLLVAGQLSPEAKTIIRNFIATPIASIATGNPCQVTTAVEHNLNNGDSVILSGVTDGTFSSSLNSTTITRSATIIGPNTFLLNGIGCTSAPTSGGLSNAHVSVIAYNQGALTSPSLTDTHKRDRLRSILHLILTSPDFSVQR